MTSTKLDWVEEETLQGIFYRAWTEHVTSPDSDREATYAELKRWMDLGERKILAALKRIRAKEMKRERGYQKDWERRRRA